MLSEYRRSSRRDVRFAVLLLVLLTGLTVPALAQVSNAVVTGIVTDEQRGILPGVTITVTNAESGVVRSTVTEEYGRYRVGGIPPGRYNVKAELPGFATQEVKDITLTIGLEYTKDFTMSVAGVQESITITGESSIVETPKTEVSGVVTQQQIETLPFQDRGTLTLSLLLPGTGTDNAGQAKRRQRRRRNFDQLNQLPGGWTLQRHGDQRRATSRHSSGGDSGICSPYDSNPGAVRATRRRGRIHRDQERNERSAWRGLRVFPQQSDEQARQVPGTAARRETGLPPPRVWLCARGPILKNRLHYFGTFERSREHSFFTVNTGRPDLYQALEGTFEGGYYTNIGFLRADYEISNKQTLFYRYTNQHTLFYCSGCGANSMAAFSNNDNLIPRDMHAIGHTWAISNRMLNEFYFMRGPASDRSYLNKDYAPKQYQQVVTIPASMGGGTIIGTSIYRFPSLIWGTYQCLPPCVAGAGTRTTFTEAQEALSITTGKHSWKVGGSIQLFPTHEWAPGNIFGTWTFNQDQYFNPSDPNFNIANLKGATLFQASFPNLRREMRNHSYAVYVTDEWKPAAGLTLNLGLRYDLQAGSWDEWLKQSDYPQPLPYVNFKSRGDKNNFGPRVGLAWNIANNGKSVVRAAYGLIYTNITNIVPRTEVSSLKQSNINITGNVPYPDPYQGRDPATFVSTSALNINIIGNNLVNAPVHTTSVGFSQPLMSETAIHVDGVYQKAVHYPSQVQVNTRNPATLVRPLPEWGNIIQYQPVGRYNYKGLLFRLEKRLSHNYQYQVPYTLSKQYGNFGSPDLVGVGIGGVITDYYNRGLDAGPSNADRRHELVVSGAGQLPGQIIVCASGNFRKSYRC